jgi:hypothetical protein
VTGGAVRLSGVFKLLARVISFPLLIVLIRPVRIVDHVYERIVIPPTLSGIELILSVNNRELHHSVVVVKQPTKNRTELDSNTSIHPYPTCLNIPHEKELRERTHLLVD